MVQKLLSAQNNPDVSTHGLIAYNKTQYFAWRRDGGKL